MIQKINIDLIKENPENPRTIKDSKFKQLVKSIKEFPQMLELRPIVVNEETITLGGNMRLKACKAAGLTEVFIIKAEDLTPEQQREFVIKDNTGYGEWDWEILKTEWDLNLIQDWGIDLPPGVKKDLKAEDDNYSIPENLETRTKPGDLIEIGPHRLFCGSCISTDAMDVLMKDQKAQMCFTDPPYNMAFSGTIDKYGNKGKWAGSIMNDKMPKKEFQEFLDSFTKSLILYVKGAFYITFYRLGIDQIYKCLGDNGIEVKSLIIWKKNNFNLSNSDYKSQYEPMFYGWVEEHNFYGPKGSTDVWEIERTAANKLHPTMKPVELVGKTIENSSIEKDIVLDFFLGSGTTMVASHQLNRICYGTELDPHYCDVIIDRMRLLDPALPIKINGINI